MPPEPRSQGGDLILATGQYAHILDRTKGNVIVYVGPSKTSMSDTDQPIVWNPKAHNYQPCEMREAIQQFPSAAEGAYVVLSNPARERSSEHPKEGSANSLAQLDMGRKVNIRGPASFALWFQQGAEVIPGHLLRSNQYLVVQVYNDEAAKANWTQAVIKRQKPVIKPAEPIQGQEQKPPPAGSGDQTPPPAAPETALHPQPPAPADNSVQEENKPPADLSMGQRFIMKGTDLSFYIPPTGLEVLPDKDGKYVREAVSLEQLEYCILLNEDGVKRFVQGPAVVFPSPTETFWEINGRRKFRAIELNPHSGIYVKVISPYQDAGKEYVAGEELFITGKTQAIYFPRPEHAIIKYGEQTIHYAVAVPAGEGRYVLNRESGEVKLVKGPAMFLPDPRKEVIVKRVLENKQVELWYPGNARALQVNAELLQAARESGTASIRAVSSVASAQFSERSEAAFDTAIGEEFGRKSSFTPPRTITLDNKYEGAVEVNVWNGYAILVVSKTGKRQITKGPTTRLLEFDEILMPTELSTGTPKSAERSLKTAYLRVLNNRVSDVVEAETSDLVQVSIRLSYRVNFEGEPEKWFDVENYVQFMCDHTRSLIRNMVKKHGIQEFHKDAIDLIRDTILGKVDGDKPRAGRSFKENGMRIYDVEVLDVDIGDEDISELLVGAQHQTVQQTLRINRARQDLGVTAEEQKLVREKQQQEFETTLQKLGLQEEVIEKETAVAVAQASKELHVQETRENARMALQEVLDGIAKAELARQKAKDDQSLEIRKQNDELNIKTEAASAEALVKKAGGFSSQLIAALQSFSDKDLAIKVAEAMAPLAILRDEGVADSFIELVKGTGLENVVGKILGHLKPGPAPAASEKAHS